MTQKSLKNITNPQHTFDGVTITLNDCGEKLPTDVLIPGHLRISPDGKQFVFGMAAKTARTKNPMLFHGNFMNCRVKKNGNYQITCPVAKSVIANFTTPEGKVNLTEVFRYQSAELQKIMIAIEKENNKNQHIN